MQSHTLQAGVSEVSEVSVSLSPLGWMFFASFFALFLFSLTSLLSKSLYAGVMGMEKH
jgi:hypothetical protein